MGALGERLLTIGPILAIQSPVITEASALLVPISKLGRWCTSLLGSSEDPTFPYPCFAMLPASTVGAGGGGIGEAGSCVEVTEPKVTALGGVLGGGGPSGTRVLPGVELLPKLVPTLGVLGF